MTAQIIPVDPFDYIIFGGTGDLAKRKLLPALYHRDHDGQLPDEARLIGASRSKHSDKAYRKFAEDALREFVPDDQIDEDTLKRFLARLHYLSLDVTDDDGWDELKKLLGDEDRIRAFYLAVGPNLFGPISEALEKHGLTDTRSRLVIEKPLGRDLESAQALNREVGAHFDEEQVFRIDHYLGKETVQNLLALRFANALFEPLWNNAHIDHVQITVAETVGVGDRAEYYDKAGAMRDMVQNHLMQLLCLVAMEPPANGDADSIRDEKLKVLRSLAPIDADNVGSSTVRAQYRAGAGPEGKVDGYLDELGHESDTATFVAIKAEVENWRWSGVPFYLRTGKRMAERMSEIVISFKPVPHAIFGKDAGTPISNQLVLRLQPDESVKQWIMIKDPGPGGMRLKHVPLDMSFAQTFDGRSPDAYERLLLDVIRGNQTLFMRRDEVEAAWAWIDPIFDAWDETNHPVATYTAGTWGPSQSIALIERDSRTWNDGTR
ncbi:glucose-6-phosphate dehydrogenase [Ahrensia sp. R2A130]|uniref:glucose-6-phosphate dehydrogenase n=1 Tax=Ahrensia sp. R2A130 TaxID=744979 RepID=UPI0001E083F3|nr:glucose-6-phosphate dehydrogenase [Ahrensia sp. R2A130]EFL89242.1 glucose-6-phosphate dehydrogenase [Ahrensia sp. R2A130]